MSAQKTIPFIAGRKTVIYMCLWCAEGVVLGAVAVGVGADEEAALLDAAVHGRVVGGGQRGL